MKASAQKRQVPTSGERVKVLLLVSNLEYGGAQRQIVELANHADPGRFEMHVGSLSEYVPLAEDLRLPAGRLHIVKKRFKFDATVVPRIARLLKGGGFHVVHSFLFDAEIAGRLAGRIVGTPAVIGSERNTNYRLKRRQLMAYRLTRSLVHRIIANSSAGAAFNSRVLGQPPSMYRVIHNGVDVRRFAPSDGAVARQRLGLALDEPVVGMFGSFKAQKNHPMFFEAAGRVLKVVPDCRFLLVGDMLHGGLHGSDAYRKEIGRLVDELGILDRCVFLGNRDDVETIYPACHLTVLPSLFEGTPNVVLESLACGVPVVVTHVSDNRKIVPDGRVGHVVPLGDAAALADRVCCLLAAPGERQAMGTRARAWAEAEFSVQALAERTGQVYLEALGCPTAGDR